VRNVGSTYACSEDFDLWKSIIREYVEEFLGEDDARDRNGAPIDYVNTPPYCHLQIAYRNQQIIPYLLGVGLDPVTWKPTILTTCVIKSDAFDELFSNMVSKNREGILELQDRKRRQSGVFKGLPFDEKTIQSYTANSSVLPAARAGLALAWQFREQLGIES
jgi:hypothetical protein